MTPDIQVLVERAEEFMQAVKEYLGT